jgi:hypothetical protein
LAYSQKKRGVEVGVAVGADGVAVAEGEVGLLEPQEDIKIGTADTTSPKTRNQIDLIDIGRPPK